MYSYNKIDEKVANSILFKKGITCRWGQKKTVKFFNSWSFFNISFNNSHLEKTDRKKSLK